MPRRASSGLNPGVLVAIVVVIAAAFFGGKSLLGSRQDSKLGGSALDMQVVAENANSLRGNAYTIEGTVDGKLTWTPDRGQVVSLKVEADSGRTDFLAIEIPPDLSETNIEREQQYAFQVRFRKGGIAVAEKIVAR